MGFPRGVPSPQQIFPYLAGPCGVRFERVCEYARRDCANRLFPKLLICRRQPDNALELREATRGDVAKKLAEFPDDIVSLVRHSVLAPPHEIAAAARWGAARSVISLAAANLC